MDFKSIDSALEIESTPIEKEIVKTEPKEVIERLKDTQSQIQKDYEYTRGNLYSLVEKGQEAINGILELAQESDSPRAFEVAGQLIKNVGDVTDKLLDLQKKMKDINKEEKGGPTTVTNNAVFVGSTSDLQKFLKSSMNPDTSK
jgi:uncharacterized protein YaaN involved in tellurite resistance